MILRPDTEVEGPLALRAFAASSSGVRPLAVEVETKPHGTLFVPEIRADMLGDGAASGACELVFVVGRPAALPSVEELAHRVAAGAVEPREGAFRVLRVRVLIDVRP